ncbi:hypothetical protein E2562_011461 [Oryza meyeriana var. granulata]|uniref:Uncharacterized protein n=1 Tax=Oryza meyeriana var. granulata TaxID=110450 RepID=A0A6G1D1A5_9ORYZ|nr:hypothetical protein E2562_011461 [Oryza meyeriana var. granulata]
MLANPDWAAPHGVFLLILTQEDSKDVAHAAAREPDYGSTKPSVEHPAKGRDQTWNRRINGDGCDKRVLVACRGVVDIKGNRTAMH